MNDSRQTKNLIVDNSIVDHPTQALIYGLSAVSEQLEHQRKYLAMLVRATHMPFDAHIGGMLMKLLMDLKDCSARSEIISLRLDGMNNNG